MPITLQDGEAAEWEFNATELMQALGRNKVLVQMGALDSRGVEYTQWWTRAPRKRIPMRIREWRRKRRQARVWESALREWVEERKARERQEQQDDDPA